LNYSVPRRAQLHPPHPQLCLPIGNETGFKTLYLLSHPAFDGRRERHGPGDPPSLKSCLDWDSDQIISVLPQINSSQLSSIAFGLASICCRGAGLAGRAGGAGGAEWRCGDFELGRSARVGRGRASSFRACCAGVLSVIAWFSTVTRLAVALAGPHSCANTPASARSTLSAVFAMHPRRLG
jgi:hypothetical protein